jgi:hypothetical protein
MSEYFPDMATPPNSERAIDARLFTDHQRALVLFRLLSKRLQAIQDALISSKDTSSDHISRERGKYLGLQEAAKIFLEATPLSLSEAELIELAELVKLTPTARIDADRTIHRFNHARNV